MNPETYIAKNFRHRSDKALANTLRMTPNKVFAIRQRLGLVREPSGKGRQDLTWLTPLQMKRWYKGKFNPHETNWMFSGRTR